MLKFEEAQQKILLWAGTRARMLREAQPKEEEHEFIFLSKLSQFESQLFHLLVL